MSMLDSVPFLREGVRAVVGWFDDRAEAPIMRQRINAGSEEYFAEAERTRGVTELEEIGGGGDADPDDDDDSDVPRDPLSALEESYDSTRLRAISVALGLSVAITAMLGLRGIGPLARFAPRTGSSVTRLLLFVAFAAAGVVQLFRVTIRAFKLRKQIAQLRSLQRPGRPAATSTGGHSGARRHS